MLAKTILTEAKRGGYYTEELPESDGEILNDAIYYSELAQKAYDEGWGAKQESIVAIVNLAQEGLVPNNSTYGEEEPLGQRYSLSERTLDGSVSPDNADHIRNGEGEKSPSHYLEEMAIENNLPLPIEIQTPPPDMPRDITELTDIKVRKLYSEYNAFLNRAKWLLAIETSDLTDATHLREDAYREAYVNLEKQDEETGKAKTATQMDIETKCNPSYIEYNNNVLKHSTRVAGWKALADIYGSNVDRLSREMTFRQQEWEKTR